MAKDVRRRATVTIPTAGGEVSELELLTALLRFRAFYAVSVRRLRSMGKLDQAISSEKDALLLAARVASSVAVIEQPARWDRLGLGALEESLDLHVDKLIRRNPIELTVVGLAVPLVMAVILSGGKFRLGPLSVSLPALGQGIKQLRKALAPASARSLRATAAKTPLAKSSPKALAKKTAAKSPAKKAAAKKPAAKAPAKRPAAKAPARKAAARSPAKRAAAAAPAAAAPAARTALSPAATWPFPTGNKP